jgi:hypothetical protein
MSLFNIFSNKPINKTSADGLHREFANQACRCVQQELDLSELTWMDATPHQRAKVRLKQDSSIAVRTYLGFNPQRDLFE